MTRLFLIACMIFVSVPAYAEMICCVNSHGEVGYTKATKCPNGYLQIDGQRLIKNDPSSTLKNTQHTFYTLDGNPIIIFDDDYAHGQQWGYRTQLRLGLYPSDLVSCDSSCELSINPVRRPYRRAYGY